jgi:hypothetical protein
LFDKQQTIDRQTKSALVKVKAGKAKLVAGLPGLKTIYQFNKHRIKKNKSFEPVK